VNSKFLKVWYTVCGVFTGLAILYYLVRLLYNIFSYRSIEGTILDKLNIVAIIFLGVSLLMLLLAIPLSKKLENRVAKVDQKKAQDQALLEKYKTKKK